MTYLRATAPPPFPRKKRFLHVSFTAYPEMPLDKLEKVFSKAADWARYASNCWIIYTALDADTWRDRVHAISEFENGYVFVIEMDPTLSTGYLPQWMWDWLSKDRSASSESVNLLAPPHTLPPKPGK
jgi:hypothetical protein